jgi:hypothetical protein
VARSTLERQGDVLTLSGPEGFLKFQAPLAFGLSGCCGETRQAKLAASTSIGRWSFRGAAAAVEPFHGSTQP